MARASMRASIASTVGTTRNGADSTSTQRDHLPAAQRAREPRAFRVADRRGDDGADEQQVGELRRAAAFPQRERDDDRAAEQRADPEAARRPLVREPRARERRGERQQPGHDGAVRGRHVAHRQRRQHRPADDDAGRDQREARPRRARRPRRAGREQHGGGQHRGDQRAAESDEHGIEIGDGEPRRRQRAAERDARRARPSSSPRRRSEGEARWRHRPVRSRCRQRRRGCEGIERLYPTGSVIYSRARLASPHASFASCACVVAESECLLQSDSSKTYRAARLTAANIKHRIQTNV